MADEAALFHLPNPLNVNQPFMDGEWLGVQKGTDMIKNLKQYIENLIHENELWRFYKTKEWIVLKNHVLEEFNHECYICKKNGIITRYDEDENGNRKLISTVHHNQFVRKHPELALSEFYLYNGKQYRNLIPVCKACHNKLHPEKRKNKSSEHFTNEERW